MKKDWAKVLTTLRDALLFMDTPTIKRFCIIPSLHNYTVLSHELLYIIIKGQVNKQIDIVPKLK